MSSESFRSFVRVVAPIRRDFASSRMCARSGMRLMSTRARGSARRSFITGRRLCPPREDLGLAAKAVENLDGFIDGRGCKVLEARWNHSPNLLCYRIARRHRAAAIKAFPR